MGTPLLHYNYTILATTTVVYPNIRYPDFILKEHLLIRKHRTKDREQT